MICIILVAGHETNLDKEIRNDQSGKYSHLEGIPKALLPGVGGKKILDYWWDIIKNRQLFSHVFLVCNADKFKYFERWASASEFPVENIVNDGTTSYETRIGATADLDLCLRVKEDFVKNEDVMVVAGDMMFQDQKFDMSHVTKYFQSKRHEGDLAIYYELDKCEEVSTRGILELCPFSSRVLQFFEKPLQGQTESRNASVVFYFLRHQTRLLITEFLQCFQSAEKRNLGMLLRWLINDQNRTFFGMKLPTGFQLIGQTTLRQYTAWLDYFDRQSKMENPAFVTRVTKRAYARVGLMGNPSDGFFGKTISLSIKNFWAEVTICESARLILTPHPLNDPTEFGSLADLHDSYGRDGYLGGLRLLQATCKKFYQYCSKHGIALAKRNFTLKYDTNVPRQVGLAGSSAIVTATLQCLMHFFNLTLSDLPKEVQPQFILEVEKSELHINAGLQDRVIQVYEGLVFMDFSQELMSENGHGNYSYLHLTGTDLPRFFLAYLTDPSDSGRIHSDVYARWKNGDQLVKEGMKSFADFTTEAVEALQSQNWTQLGKLMDMNFDKRREIYGEAALGSKNLQMIEIARKHSAHCKFPGSGGAIVGLLLDNKKFEIMRNELQQSIGCIVVDIIPNL